MSWFTGKLLYIHTLQFGSNSQKERVKEVAVEKKNIFNTYLWGEHFVCGCSWECVYFKRDVIFYTPWGLLHNIHNHTFIMLKCERLERCACVQTGSGVSVWKNILPLLFMSFLPLTDHPSSSPSLLLYTHALIPHDQQFGKAAKLWIIKIGTNYH